LRQKEKKEKKEKSKKKKRKHSSSDSDSSSDVRRLTIAPTLAASHRPTPAEFRRARTPQDDRRKKNKAEAPVSLSSFFAAGDSD
jgi:hypothetical protein